MKSVGIIAVLALFIISMLVYRGADTLPSVVSENTKTEESSSTSAMQTSSGNRVASTGTSEVSGATGAEGRISPHATVAPTPTGNYKELVRPSAFINTDRIAGANTSVITLKEFVGKKVILLHFWTTGCVACLRTFPYMNQWHEKYADDGLLIVGIHTPEFSFETGKDIVATAVQDHELRFPVVLDNKYETWNAYKNRYWPAQYIIDINGRISYTHVGEGAYEKVEAAIIQALNGRATKLGQPQVITTFAKPAGLVIPGRIRTPELYLGQQKNGFAMGNGVLSVLGKQDLVYPERESSDLVYLNGTWSFAREYMTSVTPGAQFRLRYGASRVYMLISGPNVQAVTFTLDGAPLNARAGKDIRVEQGKSVIYLDGPRVYEIIADQNGYGEHTLEVTTEKPGVNFYTILFG